MLPVDVRGKFEFAPGIWVPHPFAFEGCGFRSSIAHTKTTSVIHPRLSFRPKQEWRNLSSIDLTLGVLHCFPHSIRGSVAQIMAARRSAAGWTYVFAEGQKIAGRTVARQSADTGNRCTALRSAFPRPGQC